MEMGERLKELRLQKGATQEEVGKIINVSKATIMKYEKGLVENLKRSSIEKLANYFNVAPSYLMCLEEKTENKNNFFNEELNEIIIEKYGIDSLKFLEDYNQLNKKGKKRARDNIKDLKKVGEYTCQDTETEQAKNA